MKKMKIAPSLLGLTCLAIIKSSLAVSVLPGNSSMLTGTTFAANPDLGGIVIRDALIPFQIADNLGNIILQGNVQDRVVQSNNTGELIFAPRLRDLSNPTGVAWVTGFRMSDYTGYSTDIDFRLDGLGDIGANQVTRSAAGDNLFYRYDPNIIVPVDEGYFLSVMTDAENYDLSGMFTIYAQNDFGASVFSTRLDSVSAPSTVPVPAAVWLFGSGLVGLAGIARRKRNPKA
jgi:hypothetical protein